MRRSIVTVVGGCLAAGLGGIAHAASDHAKLPARVTEQVGVPHTDSRRVDMRVVPATILRVSHVRLEAPPVDAPKPASLLKFDMMNDGDLRVTDVRIQIAIVQKERLAADRTPPRVIVGPFTISGHATIEAGYTVNYEMLLRNLSYDCECQPDVRVVSARPLMEPEP
jgi:hypothetical protein